MTFKCLCVVPIRTTGCPMPTFLSRVTQSTSSRDRGSTLFWCLMATSKKKPAIPSVDQHQVRILLGRSMVKRSIDGCKGAIPSWGPESFKSDVLLVAFAHRAFGAKETPVYCFPVVTDASLSQVQAKSQTAELLLRSSTVAVMQSFQVQNKQVESVFMFQTPFDTFWLLSFGFFTKYPPKCCPVASSYIPTSFPPLFCFHPGFF